MGNSDGLASAFVNKGTNKVIYFEGGCFSFAFNNEIALILEDREGYFILNCDSKLFDAVKTEVESGATKKDLIKYWAEKEKDYQSSDWSASFSELINN